MQTWPVASWPDGSLKWVGLATIAGPSDSGEFTIKPGASAPAAGQAKVRVTSSDTTYEIDTRRIQARIPKWRTALIDSIGIDGRKVARNGRLVCILQTGPEGSLVFGGELNLSNKSHTSCTGYSDLPSILKSESCIKSKPRFQPDSVWIAGCSINWRHGTRQKTSRA